MSQLISLLDLPIEARLKIYSYLGLVRRCPIVIGAMKTKRARPALPPVPFQDQEHCLNWCMKEEISAWFGPNFRDCICPKLPLGVFLISKSFNQDANEIFFGHNHFVLRGHAGADLIPLRNFKASSVRSMRSLIVRLNCWPCSNGHEGYPLWTSRHKVCPVCEPSSEQGDPILHSTTESGCDMIIQWEATCKFLSSAITPGRMKFTLICDVDDLESAKQVTKPLTALPFLQKCTIRLGRRTNHDLTRISENIARRMTGEVQPTTVFPFAKLPRELQLHILGFTHLGPGGNYDARDNHICISNNKRIRFIEDGQNPKSTCCLRCTDTSADCCCPITHASYSSSCTCRELPLALFQVHRQMYQDALEVFYSSACFELDQDISTYPLRTGTNIIGFFESLPKAALRFIRNIHIQTGYHQYKDWNSDHHQEWQDIVIYLKKNFDLSKLTLVIDSDDLFKIMAGPTEEEDFFFYYEVSRQIKETLCQLRGIYDVQFKLGYWNNLEPVWGEEVVGDNYVDRRPWKKEASTWSYRFLPPWYHG